MELDRRREVGVIVKDSKIVKALIETFEADWAAAQPVKDATKPKTAPAEQESKNGDRATELLIKELHPVTATVKKALKKVVLKAGDEAFRDDNVKRTVKKIVKKAIKDAVKEVTQGEAHA
jgi:hypothetical protein